MLNVCGLRNDKVLFGRLALDDSPKTGQIRPAWDTTRGLCYARWAFNRPMPYICLPTNSCLRALVIHIQFASPYDSADPMDLIGQVSWIFALVDHLFGCDFAL